MTLAIGETVVGQLPEVETQPSVVASVVKDSPVATLQKYHQSKPWTHVKGEQSLNENCCRCQVLKDLSFCEKEFMKISMRIWLQYVQYVPSKRVPNPVFHSNAWRILELTEDFNAFSYWSSQKQTLESLKKSAFAHLSQEQLVVSFPKHRSSQDVGRRTVPTSASLSTSKSWRICLKDIGWELWKACKSFESSELEFQVGLKLLTTVRAGELKFNK